MMLSQEQLRASDELEGLRPRCSGQGGGITAMLCIRICAAHRLMIPDWLAVLFIRRHDLVAKAAVPGFDAAFGCPWSQDPVVRAKERETLRMQALVHHRVFELGGPDAAPMVPIGKELFAQIGREAEIDLPGHRVKNLYYGALKNGYPNVAKLRPRVVR